jgi:tartrate dehydratase beta subunit/fumarate hydratase class I family protein
VKKVELVAYEDLGPEAIRKLTVADLPLVRHQ